MREIAFIVTHCSATPPSMNIGADEIFSWHTDPAPNGNGWSDIGYHFVICRDGLLQFGRPLEIAGAHVRGFNSLSMGVCLVGGVSEKNRAPEDNFTDEQWECWQYLMHYYGEQYPLASFMGHRDFPAVTKACPSFDVTTKLRELGVM